uniref:Uncharacterized protein n=1 Tax=Daucus carota subsp. sativus TaxID=79200 RepID=A0A164T441_DAUCS
MKKMLHERCASSLLHYIPAFALFFGIGGAKFALVIGGPCNSYSGNNRTTRDGSKGN